VRLDPDEKQRLQEIAGRMGTTVSTLVRMLVRSFVEDYERCDGRVTIPPDWPRMLTTTLANANEAAEKTISYVKRESRVGARQINPCSTDGAGKTS